MKITLSKDEVEKIVLDYINSYFASDFNGKAMFNRAYIDSYGYASFATIENSKEDVDGTGT